VIKIVLDGDQPPEEELVTHVCRIAEIAAEREGIKDRECELSLLFADTDEIQELNLNYRGIDSPTDVLSFPMMEPLLLGDIVICREIAESQAVEYGHSSGREIAFLFTHGLLHLLGYDHGEAMRAAEEDILEQAGIQR